MNAPTRPTLPFDVTWRTVLTIALPMTIAYLSTPLLGLVDTAVIGQLGDPVLVGGIAIGGIIFDLAFTTFNFLRSGTTGLTAQAVGANNNREIPAILMRSLCIALIAGIAIILLQVPIRDAGLFFLGGSDAVQAATASYFDIRVYSAPFLLANYAILGWYIGLGRAGAGLALQLFLNGLNIALSLWFVMGLSLGVEGVAAATVISEAATTLLGGAAVLWTLKGSPWPSRAHVFDREQFLKTMALNRDIMIRSFTLLIAFSYFVARSADQGEVILATNTILEKFIMTAAFFLDGLATAAEQLVGRAVGGNYRPAFRKTVRLTVFWSFVICGLLSILIALFGPQLLDLMTTSDEIRATGREYLVWVIIAPVFGVLAYVMDGIFIGATWSRDMRNMMLVSLAAFLAAYHLFFPIWGNDGLWLALTIFLGIRGLSLSVMCRWRADRTFSPESIALSNRA